MLPSMAAEHVRLHRHRSPAARSRQASHAGSSAASRQSAPQRRDYAQKRVRTSAQARTHGRAPAPKMNAARAARLRIVREQARPQDAAGRDDG